MSNPNPNEAQILSESLANTVQARAAATVRVDARRRRPSSGTVWSPELVLTPAHAVEREEGITVGFEGGETGARLLGRDPYLDLAVLKVDSPLPDPQWTPAPAVRAGHLAIALARPGRTIRASMGLVSAASDTFRTPAGARLERYVEVDIGLPPGFSGGPIVDPSGRLIGFGSTGIVRGTPLAISHATLAPAVERIVREGSVKRAYLGVGGYPVRLPEPLAAKANAVAGLLLFSVDPDGPAAKAGISFGDALVGLGGEAVSDVGELARVLSEKKPGEKVAVRVIRAGAVAEFEVELGAR